MSLVRRAGDLKRLFNERSFIIESPGIIAEKQPDGRVQLRAAIQRKSAPAPAAGCQDPISLVSSGITLGCCVSDGGGGSWGFTSTFENSTFNLPNVPGVCSGGACTCFWTSDLLIGDDSTLSEYSDAGCSSGIFSGSSKIYFDVAQISGTYYIVGTSIQLTAKPTVLIFFATAASISGAISNQLAACSSSAGDYTLDNAYTALLYGGPVHYTVFGYDGSVTIT